MTKIPQDLVHRDHEWIQIDGTSGVMGITDYAQHAMGDIVYVELPEIKGERGQSRRRFLVVESVKGANDVFSPVSGKVAEVNEDLDGAPELLNEDPYANRLVKLEPSEPQGNGLASQPCGLHKTCRRTRGAVGGARA